MFLCNIEDNTANNGFCDASRFDDFIGSLRDPHGTPVVVSCFGAIHNRLHNKTLVLDSLGIHHVSHADR